MTSEAREKVDTPSSEKGNIEQKSIESIHISEVDLANYYEEKAGSLVIDPEYVAMLPLVQ